MSTAVVAALSVGLSVGLLTGCAEPPIQSGNNQVPELNVALAAAKDGKYATQAWPMVDGIMVGWLDGAYAPGCAVGVAIDDEIVYLKGYGRSRLGLDAEDWSVETMGSVASVSKTFTALAAMRQVQNGWLDLEEHAGDRLPLEGDLADAQLFKLLSHTSGVGGASHAAANSPNWTNGSPMDLCGSVETPDAADPYCTEVHRAALDPVALTVSYSAGEANNVTTLDPVDVDADPYNDGWQAVYSNVGYTVAGGMVGAVAEDHGYTGYEHYVWDTVGQWAPSWITPGQATSLALTHRHRADDIPHRAVGYYDANWGVGPKSWQSGETWETVNAQGSWIGPSGGWALTIGDFTRIVLAYSHDKIVNAATRSMMETPMGYFSLGPDPSNLPPYGLGVLVDDNIGSIRNGGDIGPSQGDDQQSSHGAHWAWWPNALPGGVDVGVAMICNNGAGSQTLYSRSYDIVQELQADPLSRPQSTQTHSTTPSPSGVNTRSYKIDASKAYVLLPSGFPILPAAANPMIATVDLGQKTVRFSQPGSGQAGSGPTLGQASAAKLTTAGRLTASGGTLLLGVGPMTLPLFGVSLSLQVSNDGSKLYDGTVKGTVDARHMVSLNLVGSVREVCTAVGEAGGSCLACADGAKSCFVASIGGVKATRLP
jgi:CubicO group peptidase (beta-lactamase class C family)